MTAAFINFVFRLHFIKSIFYSLCGREKGEDGGGGDSILSKFIDPWVNLLANASRDKGAHMGASSVMFVRVAVPSAWFTSWLVCPTTRIPATPWAEEGWVFSMS
jgi:hypothetical protein